jgi:DNA polymerase-3 subunit gamma/tau
LSQVLALKYRPKRFEDLIGQESISNTLALALDKDRLSNAYLFSGLRGSGKTSTARIFSKALLCDNGPTSKPCDQCQNCNMANSNSHIDIIEMDAASHRGLDDIKDLIEHTKYKPSVARFKVFIIDEVHMLTIQAFNALLKTLEEPPEFVKFILATTDPLKLPATILSRTQHFRFKSIKNDNIIKHIEFILNKENIDFENSALEIIARSGNGSLRDTLTILDQAIVYSKQNITIDSITSMLGIIDPKFIEQLLNTIFDKNIDKIKSLINELQTYGTEAIIDEIIIFLKEKLFSNENRYSVTIIDRFFRVLNDAKYMLSINANDEFVLSLTFLKMVEATKIKDIDQLIKEYEKNNEIQTTTQEEIKPISNNNNQPQIQTKKVLSSEEKFESLKKLILERSADIGKCFERIITFKSIDNNQLNLEVYANEPDKELFRKNYKTIKQLIHQIFEDISNINFEVKEYEENNSIQEVQEVSNEQIEHIENIPNEIVGIHTTEETISNIENIPQELEISIEPQNKEQTIQEKLSYDLEHDEDLKKRISLLDANNISLIKR